MNKKILIISSIVVIPIIAFISFVYINEAIQWQNQQLEKKEHSTFNIQTQDDLTKIVDVLVHEMYEKEIFFSMKDVIRLTGLDMDRIQLAPNYNNGYSSGKGTFPGGYILHRDWSNGTRTYDKFLDDGTLLKSIRINDDREKEILIILK